MSNIGRGAPFKFSGFYYDDFLKELILSLSKNAPEITSRDPSDPVIQEQRSKASALHFCSVLADHIAQEVLPYNARLFESVRQHLAMIGYKLRLERPAYVDILAQLDNPLQVKTTVVNKRALVESDPVDADNDPIYFEYVGENIVLDPTDKVSSVLVYDRVSSGNDGILHNSNTFIKYSGEDFEPTDVNKSEICIYDSDKGMFGSYKIIDYVNADTVIIDGEFLPSVNLKWYLIRIKDVSQDLLDGLDTNMWELFSPANKVFIGMDEVLFDSFEMVLSDAGMGFSGIWEYYEPNLRFIAPRVILDGDPTGLVFDLTSLFGNSDHSGAQVVVEYLPSGAKNECTVYFEDGVNKIKTIGTLGQSDPSLVAKDYVVGTNWQPLKKVNDRSRNFIISGKVSYELPQDEFRAWGKNSVGTDEAKYWVRYRINKLNTAHCNSSSYDTVTYDNATDFTTARELFEEIVINFNNHIATFDDVHIHSSTNTMTYGSPINNAELADRLNTAKGVFNDHLNNTQHFSFVDSDLVVVPDATEQINSIMILVNSIKASFNNHLMSFPISPVMNTINVDSSTQYILFPMTQGRYVIDNPIGSSNGLPGQMFKLRRGNYIEGTDRVEVNEDGSWKIWTRVENFINSSSLDRHYKILTNGNDETFVIFGGNKYEDGSGQYGMTPPLGDGNVRVGYRTGSDENGNVGADSVNTLTGGMMGITSVTNPRPASGWLAREGSSIEQYDLVMDRASVSLKTAGKCVTATDIEQFAQDWVDKDGVSPVARAFAIEEAYGPKTVGLWVVAPGHGFLTNNQLQSLSEYFNGDGKTHGVVLANTGVVVQNFKKRVLVLDIDIIGKITSNMVQRRLLELIDPLKRDSNNEFLWKPGEVVYSSKIVDEIHNISNNIRSVTVSGADVQLGEQELPVIDIGNTTINIVS